MTTTPMTTTPMTTTPMTTTPMTTTPMTTTPNPLYFYFSALDRKLRYRDGRPIGVGTTHEVAGPLGLCRRGLHASRSPFDALRYAPGPALWLVRLEGEILHAEDKSCAERRTYLAEFDATDLLRRFARQQAAKVIHLIEPYCRPGGYQLVCQWLATGDETLRAAASSAAWSAARSAARSTEAAAWAAGAAAWAAEAAEAAEAAARSAAEAVAWAARSAGAAEAAEAEFLAMIREETGWTI